jgi:3-hydroxyisobutyrate dehydrogenase-like beta-hydroxyacid dehydrogenase
MTKLAFLGLGVMGYPMAGHLAAKGVNGRVKMSQRAAQNVATLGLV